MSFQPEKPTFLLKLYGELLCQCPWKFSVHFSISGIGVVPHWAQSYFYMAVALEKNADASERDLLFAVDIVLPLQLLALYYAICHLLYCFSTSHSLWQLVQVQQCRKSWVWIQAEIHMFFPATRTQRDHSSSVSPNNIISKAPYKNMSNWASDKGLSVCLLGQWKIPNSHNSFQLFSVFIPEPFRGHRI